MTLLIMTTLDTGNITYNAITLTDLTYKMTLLITVNKKHICNVAFINVISKVVIREVFYKHCYTVLTTG
jgi:hypothetical protein